MKLRPYKFKPLLKTVIWGGERIMAFKGISSDLQQVGESWEVSGYQGRESVVDGGPDDGLRLSQLIERHGAALMGEEAYQRFGNHFPLLVKLIDARHDLSIQVHPDNEMAQRLHSCSGKTEMWYVVDNEPGAQIIAGFNKEITPLEYERRVADGTIMDIVTHYDTHPGDVFFLPAGCIHSIGAGNLVAEIQQTSDITYRVFDYNRIDSDGRLRELHIERAKEAIDFSVHDSYIDLSHRNFCDETVMVSCDYFVVHRHQVEGELMLTMPASFMVMMCVNGAVNMVDDNGCHTPLKRGETTLIPACLTRLHISGSATLLCSHV